MGMDKEEPDIEEMDIGATLERDLARKKDSRSHTIPYRLATDAPSRQRKYRHAQALS